MPHIRIIRYCRVCGDNVKDTTKRNHKLLCDRDSCKKKDYHNYMKRYNAKYRAVEAHKEEYRKRLFAKRRKGGSGQAGWACQDCKYRTVLKFDPLSWKNKAKLRAMKCPECKQKAAY